MFKEIKNNKLLYIGWAAILFLIVVGVATSAYLTFAAFLIFTLFCLFAKVKCSYILLFGLLPVAHIFKLAPNTTSLFTVCEIMTVVISVLRTNRISRKLGISLLVFALFMIVSDIQNLDALGIIKVIVGIYFVYLCVTQLKMQDVVRIAYVLSASVIVTLLLSMNTTYFENVVPYLDNLDYMQGDFGDVFMRMGGFMGDPNYCSVLILVSLNLLGVLYFHKKIGNEFWIFLCFLIPLGFFTYSKSYLLCIVAFVLLFIVFVLFPKHKGWAVVSIIAVSVIVALALNGEFESINVILDRFLSSDITTGRASLNVRYLEYIWNNPLVLFFGEGVGADRFVGAENNVHNIYIEGLFKLGIVGFSLYICSLWICASARKKNRSKKKLVNYFPLVFLLALYCALAGITMYELPFYLAIAFMSMNYNTLEEDEEFANSSVRR